MIRSTILIIFDFIACDLNECTTQLISLQCFIFIKFLNRFYVGCDLCNNWFHGECVNITEKESKDLSEFICSECKHARDTQELFCLCRQPYDETQFYICCDKCQDWFHGRCVGILQCEAESIDEYICPNCQKNSSVNFANMKDMGSKEYDELKKLIKQIQVREHIANAKRLSVLFIPSFDYL